MTHVFKQCSHTHGVGFKLSFEEAGIAAACVPSDFHTSADLRSITPDRTAFATSVLFEFQRLARRVCQLRLVSCSSAFTYLEKNAKIEAAAVLRKLN